MSNPTVCAVCLVNGRPEMVRRAIRSFQAQTYDPIKRMLLVLDTGAQPYEPAGSDSENEAYLHGPQHAELSIGALRNMANSAAKADILLHCDSDDWSHPNRIAEQVALLQASGKECVGYRDMLFWDMRHCKHGPDYPCDEARAWLYTNAQPSYCLGTSLCYWRRVWERRPFEDLPKGPMGMGEDHQWLAGVNALGVTSLFPMLTEFGPKWQAPVGPSPDPRMIASVHGGNSTDILRVAIQVKDKMLRRAPEFDAYCAERMKL